MFILSRGLYGSGGNSPATFYIYISRPLHRNDVYTIPCPILQMLSGIFHSSTLPDHAVGGLK